MAGIIDRGGGLRVVVGPPDRMHCHVGPGEKLYVVPNLRRTEPANPREIIPIVESYVKSQQESGK